MNDRDKIEKEINNLETEETKKRLKEVEFLKDEELGKAINKFGYKLRILKEEKAPEELIKTFIGLSLTNSIVAIIFTACSDSKNVDLDASDKMFKILIDSIVEQKNKVESVIVK